MAIVTLNMMKAPERRDFPVQIAGDWGELDEFLDMSEHPPGTVVLQAAFTAKRQPTDADAAVTSFQRVITPTLGDDGVLEVDALTGQVWAHVDFPPADIDKLLDDPHEGDLQVWFRRPGEPVKYRTVLDGRLVAKRGITSRQTLLNPIVESITIEPAGALAVIEDGAAVRLTARFWDQPAGAGTELFGRAPAWSLVGAGADRAVLTPVAGQPHQVDVSASGAGTGPFTVRAAVDGAIGDKAGSAVLRTDVASVTLPAPYQADVGPGSAIQLAPVARDYDNNVVPGVVFTYQSSANGTALVSNAGVVTRAAGAAAWAVANITAQAPNGVTSAPLAVRAVNGWRFIPVGDSRVVEATFERYSTTWYRHLARPFGRPTGDAFQFLIPARPVGSALLRALDWNAEFGTTVGPAIDTAIAAGCVPIVGVCVGINDIYAGGATDGDIQTRKRGIADQAHARDARTLTMFIDNLPTGAVPGWSDAAAPAGRIDTDNAWGWSHRRGNGLGLWDAVTSMDGTNATRLWQRPRLDRAIANYSGPAAWSNDQTKGSVQDMVASQFRLGGTPQNGGFRTGEVTITDDGTRTHPRSVGYAEMAIVIAATTTRLINVEPRWPNSLELSVNRTGAVVNAINLVAGRASPIYRVRARVDGAYDDAYVCCGGVADRDEYDWDNGASHEYETTRTLGTDIPNANEMPDRFSVFAHQAGVAGQVAYLVCGPVRSTVPIAAAAGLDGSPPWVMRVIRASSADAEVPTTGLLAYYDTQAGHATAKDAVIGNIASALGPAAGHPDLVVVGAGPVMYGPLDTSWLTPNYKARYDDAGHKHRTAAAIPGVRLNVSEVFYFEMHMEARAAAAAPDVFAQLVSADGLTYLRMEGRAGSDNMFIVLRMGGVTYEVDSGIPRLIAGQGEGLMFRRWGGGIVNDNASATGYRLKLRADGVATAAGVDVPVAAGRPADLLFLEWGGSAGRVDVHHARVASKWLDAGAEAGPWLVPNGHKAQKQQRAF